MRENEGLVWFKRLSAALGLCIMLTASQSCSLTPQDVHFACVYSATASSDDNIIGVDDCGYFDTNGEPLFAEKPAQQIHEAAKDHLVCVYVGIEQGSYRVFYFYNDKHYETVFYDNGCDYYQEGLVRVFDNGKTAFADEQLNIVLRPHTDIATTFWAGHAVVCNGPFNPEEIGASTREDAGHCGLINHQGELVLPLEYSLESEVFEQYILAHNGCPPPPVNDAQQALCYVQWLGKVHEYVPEGDYESKVLDLDSKWQVTLSSQKTREKFIIEIRRDTAQMIIMQRQPIKG